MAHMLKCFGEYGVMPILILYGCDKSYILHSKYFSESFVVKDECAAINLLSDKADKWKDKFEEKDYAQATRAEAIRMRDELAMAISINNDDSNKYQ